MALSALIIFSLLGLLAATVFLVLALLAAWRFRRERPVTTEQAATDVPVTLLKPLHGLEPRLRESLESFFRQDYPQFQLLFGARNQHDPALGIVRDLAAQYPAVDCKIVLAGEPPWANAKVWSLEKMLEHAKHEHLIISDSDVEVAPNYIRNVVAPLRDRAIGCVTCLYRGVPAGGLWSRLEALGMSVEMTSGVLIARMLEGVKFALGPTMATRKDALAKIGGFRVFADYCSDDYLLGNLIHAAGYKVVLSHHVINHIVLNRSLPSSVAHQVRWMKSTKFSRPKGHFGAALTFAMPFGLLGWVAASLDGAPVLGFGIFLAACVNRMVQSIVIGGIVNDRRALRDAWLYPLRDLMGFFFWLASYGSNVITWRGQKYRLLKGGKMELV